MKWLLGIGINAVLFIAIAGYFESFYVSSVGAALGASFMLSFLNILVRPILIIFTLPVTILTLGFFLFIINAVTLMLTDSLMGSSFETGGFGMALLTVLIMSFVNLIMQSTLLKKEN
jgi:putative membrane protein